MVPSLVGAAPEWAHLRGGVPAARRHTVGNVLVHDGHTPRTACRSSALAAIPQRQLPGIDVEMAGRGDDGRVRSGDRLLFNGRRVDLDDRYGSRRPRIVDHQYDGGGSNV